MSSESVGGLGGRQSWAERPGGSKALGREQSLGIQKSKEEGHTARGESGDTLASQLPKADPWGDAVYFKSRRELLGLTCVASFIFAWHLKEASSLACKVRASSW